MNDLTHELIERLKKDIYNYQDTVSRHFETIKTLEESIEEKRIAIKETKEVIEKLSQ